MPEDPGLLEGAATTLRLIVGWAFTALAVLNLAMGLDSVSYALFHGVLLIAGLTLLGLPRVGRRPRRAPGWPARPSPCSASSSRPCPRRPSRAVRRRTRSGTAFPSRCWPATPAAGTP